MSKADELTAQRDEARRLVETQRAQILELTAKAARAEGEAAGLRGTVSVLQVAVDALRLADVNQRLVARVAELEGQLTACVTHPPARSPGVTRRA